MKIIQVKGMANICYLARHWGRWYYVDQNGFWQPISDVIVSLRNLKEEA